MNNLNQNLSTGYKTKNWRRKNSFALQCLKYKEERVKRFYFVRRICCLVKPAPHTKVKEVIGQIQNEEETLKLSSSHWKYIYSFCCENFLFKMCKPFYIFITLICVFVLGSDLVHGKCFSNFFLHIFHIFAISPVSLSGINERKNRRRRLFLSDIAFFVSK